MRRPTRGGKNPWETPTCTQRWEGVAEILDGKDPMGKRRGRHACEAARETPCEWGEGKAWEFPWENHGNFHGKAWECSWEILVGKLGDFHGKVPWRFDVHFQ